jgi:hypothetical protein
MQTQHFAIVDKRALVYAILESHYPYRNRIFLGGHRQGGCQFGLQSISQQFSQVLRKKDIPRPL